MEYDLMPQGIEIRGAIITEQQSAVCLKGRCESEMLVKPSGSVGIVSFSV